MDTMVQEIVAHIDASTSLTAGTDLFMDVLPHLPDNAVQVVEYPGDPPLEEFGDTVGSYEVARGQVLVRNTSPLTARTLAVTIWKLLGAISNATVQGGTYMRVGCLQSPFPLKNDEQDRSRVVFNFEAVRKVV